MNHTLIAKPIIKDQYWVVTNGTEKVGNVVANNSGYSLKINGIDQYFNSSEELVRKTKIRFQTIKPTSKKDVEKPELDYPTTGRMYNSMVDIKRKLNLYTKTPKSKCYHAAGWFAINQSGTYEKIFCPKYIFVQRYPYLGPYKTEEEADQALHTR